MILRNREYDFYNNTYIMGILNATPDSFSDGGKYTDVEIAVAHALEMEREGAAIIDIGGESTRPGFTPVGADEECDRIIPVIKELRAQSDVIISVDTTKAIVAKEAMNAGADIINDVSGLLADENMASVIASTNAVCVLMHDGSYFNTEVKKQTLYDNYVDKLFNELYVLVKHAIDSKIPNGNIILDPGVGFGKTVDENLCIIKNLDAFSDLGYPILLGCSNKSVIGKSLDLPVDQRSEGTIVTSVFGTMYGAGILRVHDVTKNIRAVKMTQAICKVGE